MMLVTAVRATAVPTKEIAPGVKMPIINLGTGGKDIGSDVSNFTASWLRRGQTGIDTAWVYKDQKYIAKAIAESRATRSDIFVTTKIPGEFGYYATKNFIKQDLQQLATTYADLILVHFPRGTAMKGTWQALEEAVRDGAARAIGVSNFQVSDLTNLLSFAKVTPAVNQCEHNILNHKDDLIAFCAAHNITYEGYSPLGRGSTSILNNPTVKAIGTAHNKSAPQVAIRWIVQQGHTLAVEADKLPYQEEDVDVFSWSLTDDEMETLNRLQKQVESVYV